MWTITMMQESYFVVARVVEAEDWHKRRKKTHRIAIERRTKHEQPTKKLKVERRPIHWKN